MAAAATMSSAATCLRLERGTGATLRSSSKHNAQLAPLKKKILMMGGTRLIGRYLARMLVEEGHEIKHMKGDGKGAAAMKDALLSNKFDMFYVSTFIFCSSPGVYFKSDERRHFEVDAVNPKSRHVEKLDTESYLSSAGVTWTSVRPVYIHGPLNCNPVEEWFFHHRKATYPRPQLRNLQITQLGHVKHFFTSIKKAEKDLNWAPEFDLIAGLKDSYEKDFVRGTFRQAADFIADDIILAKVKGLAAV
eukprot:jgi/Chlat1/1470/Chrsp12S02017